MNRHQVKVIHLPAKDPSADQDHILGVPNNFRSKDAESIALGIIKHHKEYGDDEWGAIEKSLIEAGFYIVEIIDGPCWD